MDTTSVAARVHQRGEDERKKKRGEERGLERKRGEEKRGRRRKREEKSREER